MSEITRVGVDLAKQVIPVHGVDATECVVMREPGAASSAHHAKDLAEFLIP